MGRTLRETTNQLVTVLTTAAAERDRRPDLIQGPDGRAEPAWVAYERAEMRAAVDRLRADAGKAPVQTASFERAESGACGHIDYVTKFALGCADLVHLP